MCLFRLDRLAGDDHVERSGYTDDTRQTLRAPGAGDDPEAYLWQAHVGAGNGDAVGAAERQLQSTAERVAVNCRDHRLFGLLKHVYDLRQRWRRHRFGRAEFGDICACREHAARTGQNDGCDVRIVRRRLKRTCQRCSQRQTETVDRWMIQREYDRL